MGYIVARTWAGTGYNKDVRLIERHYDDGRTVWEFRDRHGAPSNPTEQEATDIISRWKLKEI